MANRSKNGAQSREQEAAERERLVYQLIAAAAERDLGTVYGAAGAAALEAITAGLRPQCEFAPPPSYAAFMATFGSLRVLDAAGEVAGLCVYTPREALAHTLSEVRPSRGADHLVAFADGGGGGHWCFDTRAPGPELPVRAHHRDETAQDGEPDYPDFMAWLRGEIAEQCQPR